MPFSKLKLGIPSVSSSNPTLGGSNPEDVDEVDGEGQSILMGIISQLRPGCDLSRITLPTFILERKSMLERITNQLQQPNFVLEAHDSKDEVKRFLLVVKWYMSCWHICPKAVKKPLNPILGEYFTCFWELEDGSKAYYFSEQTSHHPPKSSYFYIIPEHGIRVDGIVAPKSRFLGNSTAALMEGITKLTFLDVLDKNGQPETYTLTQPNMYGRGILFGKMKFELGDHMIIKCPSTNMEADIEFKTKGFIYGGYNHILGDIKRNGESLYELSGKWTETMELKDLATNKRSVFFDCIKDASPLAPIVRPLEEQGEFESRKLWKKVTDALLERNHTVATEEKFKIEDAQRERAKLREQENVDFHPKLFRPLSPKETVAPGSDKLEFVIYKDHVLNRHKNNPQALLEDILTIAPIVPGQNFTPEFEIPAHEKVKH